MSPQQMKIKEARRNKEIRSRLIWALNDLKSDATRYDNGEYSAINRSSVTLRTIFYNSGSSKSILKQLRIEGKYKMPTFTKEFSEQERLNYGALRFMRLPKYFAGEKYFDTMLFYPEKPIEFIKIKKWLKQPLVRVGCTDLTRENLIIIMANQDGGAHVDAEITKAYKDLRDGDDSFKININKNNNKVFEELIGGVNDGSFVYPRYINWGLTRQIVHETLLTFNKEFNLNYSPNFENNINSRFNKRIYNLGIIKTE